MLQSEFETRVGMRVTPQEYSAIEDVYSASDVDKDEFCKLWSKMNHKRIATYKAEKAAREKAEKLRENLWHIWHKFAFKEFEWKVSMLNHTVLNKREEKALQDACIDLKYFSYDAGGYLYYNMLDTLHAIAEFLGICK